MVESVCMLLIGFVAGQWALKELDGQYFPWRDFIRFRSNYHYSLPLKN